jgi:hypothetical protein
MKEEIEWIDAGKRPPILGEAVLMRNIDGTIRVGYKLNCWATLPGHWAFGFVTHWADLPNGPTSRTPPQSSPESPAPSA